MAEARDGKAIKRIAWTIFVMLFVSYCYFIQNPHNWNSVPRIALAISIIEDGSLSIDKFMFSTGDIAYYNGRYYSDKAPGLTFMSLPPVAAASLYVSETGSGAKWLGFDGKVRPGFIFVEQWAIVFTSALVTALTAAAVYYFALRLGAGLAGAVFASLAYGLATPAWGWASAFFSHNVSGGFLFFGFFAVYRLASGRGGGRRDALLGFASGASLSWAVVLELTSAPASAVIALYGLWSARVWGKERLLRALVPAAAGALLFISPLLAYNYAITGNPFESLYRYAVYFPEMRAGSFGHDYPDPVKLWYILFGRGWGLFVISPILLAAPFGIWRLWRRPGGKAASLAIAAVCAYYLIANSSYHYWTGGGSTGPRYVVSMLPFLCLPLAVLWADAGRALRAGLTALWAVSFFFSLACASVSMMRHFGPDTNILFGEVLPSFLGGGPYQISLLVWMLVPDSLKPGFTGQVSLLPLYLILIAFLLYITLALRRAERQS